MALSLPPPLQNLGPLPRWVVPLAVVIAASVLGHFFGLSVGLLTLAGGVLCGSIWLFWSSLQGLAGDAPLTLEEAISLGAPSAEEEQKRAVLRALKDLEYERAVGKINDADYESLAEHYRNEAKRLLRAVDDDLGPERERAEQLLAERLAARAASEPPPGARADSDEAANGQDADEPSEAAPALAKRPSSDAAP